MGELLTKPEVMLWLVPLLPLLGFLINGFFGKRMPLSTSGAVACISIVMSFGFAVILFTTQIARGQDVATAPWVWMSTGGFNVDFRLLADPLSGLLMLVVTGVGSLIHIYSVGYMGHDKAYWRFFSYLNLFCFAMLMLVLGDSLVLLFLGWEGVGLCSYLLIGFWYTHLPNSNAGIKAFVVNRIGDFGFMLGMFLIFWHFHTLNYGELAASMRDAGSAPILTWACVCLFIGACGKSAQIPLYVWLPDAMAGPTPVSALIHAATMVTAGIYMIARLNFIWVRAEDALTLVAIVGSLTAFFAGTIGLVQRDIKKVLAYSTVSQLGFMFMALGLGAFPVAVFHLFTHAFFKALLFLGAGSVIHSLEHTLGHGNPDSQDLFKMGGLKHKLPLTCATMIVGACGLAGIPLFSGFFSKDAILFAAFERHDALGMIVYSLGLAAAVCTAFYSFRLIGLCFFGKWRGLEAAYAHADESPRSMGLPLLVLAAFAFGAGYLWIPAAFGVHYTPFADLLSPVWAQGQAYLQAAQSHWAMPVEHTAESIGKEWVNMLISSVVAIGVSIFAFSIYSKPAGVERMHKLVADPKSALAVPYRVLLNKYYVDEIYTLAIVRPLQLLSDVLFVIVDVILIDLVMVNGSGLLVEVSSKVARRVQTGNVRHYLFAFAIGMVVLLALFLAVL
ncbi:MAG: NADH-quinone oxidoreductase subunit L [Planctomycetes bacterium]|nr:NADH-quinone oxidoreductase subunit L [Planctomycetota bacterium]